MKRPDCPIICTLYVLGDKMTLVIIRDALFKQFTTYGEFQSSPEKISSNILASRLQKMVSDGIFIKSSDPNNKLKIHYNITEKGRDLRDVILAAGLWGNKYIDGTCDILEKNKQAQAQMSAQK